MRKPSVEQETETPWRHVHADGSIVLDVHAQPGAKRTEVVGIHGDALKIRLAAPAVDGLANDALIGFLAESFAVPRRHVTLIRGRTWRSKVVRIASPAARPDRDWGL